SITHITSDADDLTPDQLHFGGKSSPDCDAVGEWITCRPVPLRHGLIDDHDARRAARVLIRERAAPHNRNLECAKVRRRNRRKPAAAMRRAVERSSLNDDGKAEAAL